MMALGRLKGVVHRLVTDLKKEAALAMIAQPVVGDVGSDIGVVALKGFACAVDVEFGTFVDALPYDYWASFKGQGVYFDPEFNINGTRKTFTGYNADVIADLALGWLDDQQKTKKPFCLYVGFKAVHYPFQPAKRHHGRYQDKPIDYPETMALTEENYQTQSRWIRDRRYGIHGIDHMQTGALDKDPVPDFDDLYWRFAETVHGLDENVGRIMSFLDNHGFMEDTLVVYMGDNGFALGEHGFYDKRDAFEESIRVPMLAWGAGIEKPGSTVTNMVLNIDVAPTLLDVAGVKVPANQPKMEGRSFLPAIQGKELTDWRKHMLYEYHWEWNFPAQPTTLAIRKDRFKYIYYHGLWDRNGFYDLETDPHERHNLIDIPAYKEQVLAMRTQLFKELEEANGLTMPIRPPKGDPFHDRKLNR